MKRLALMAPFLLGACATPVAQPVAGTNLGPTPPPAATHSTAVPAPLPQPAVQTQTATATKESPPPPATPAELSIAKSNRAFAVSLYRKLAAKPGNVFISPISIAGAFGPVAAGARGQTRAEIGKVLHFPANEDVLHRNLGSLLDRLETGGDGPQVSVANSMWLMQGYKVNPGFVDLAKGSYGAEVDTLDFSNSPAAAARINTWVDRETKSRIPKLFEPDAFNDLTRVVVTNAVHFLGDWKVQFDPRRTRPQTFFLADGTTREVPMMVADNMVAHCLCMGEPGYGEVRAASAADVLELPYKGDRLSMVVILPLERNGLPAVEAGLSAAKLEEWLARLDSRPPFRTSGDFSVALPKVQIESSYDLVPPLKALGMKVPFTRGAADFTGIAPDGRRLYISDALHKTFLKVDEKGTEAAAATAVVISAERGGWEFRADHPFLFLIRDRQTGAILFIGRIAEP